MSSRDARRSQQRVSLLVRNLPLDMRQEEVRAMFEKYGDVRDVYLPKDYYTGRPRGFGFIEFLDTRDAEDALYGLDRTTVNGREISVVMSKESRKTPRDMIKREQETGRGPRSGDRRGRDDRGDHRGGRSRSRSRDRGRGGYSDRRRYSRSRSRSRDRRRSSRSRSRTPPRRDSRSPARRDSRSPARRDSRSRSPRRDSRSPRRDSRSPERGSPRRDDSRSPEPRHREEDDDAPKAEYDE